MRCCRSWKRRLTPARAPCVCFSRTKTRRTQASSMHAQALKAANIMTAACMLPLSAMRKLSADSNAFALTMLLFNKFLPHGKVLRRPEISPAPDISRPFFANGAGFIFACIYVVVFYAPPYRQNTFCRRLFGIRHIYIYSFLHPGLERTGAQ